MSGRFPVAAKEAVVIGQKRDRSIGSRSRSAWAAEAPFPLAPGAS